MTALALRLREQPWWDCRFTWGQHVCVLLVLNFIWHSEFPMAGLDLDELIA